VVVPDLQLSVSHRSLLVSTFRTIIFCILLSTFTLHLQAGCRSECKTQKIKREGQQQIGCRPRVWEEYQHTQCGRAHSVYGAQTPYESNQCTLQQKQRRDDDKNLSAIKLGTQQNLDGITISTHPSHIARMPNYGRYRTYQSNINASPIDVKQSLH